MKNKLVFWIVTALLGVCCIYILTSTVILPVFTKSALPKVVVHTVEEKEKNGKPSKNADDTADTSNGGSSKESVDKLLELKKMEFLTQSRLALATEDSNYLVLDLSNKLAILELKGVVLHEAKIVKLTLSNSIKHQHAESLINWASEPFSVKNIEATIPKIVFFEKIAPKDTLEANKMSLEPKITKQGDVLVIMDFHRNLRLIISQSELPDPDGLKEITELRKSYSKLEVSRSLDALTHLNREPIKPQIEIVVSKTDATILYKSLPLNPRMILKF